MNPVDEIKSRLDIVDVVSGYISLNQTGGNLKARCPFHNEKTPSFMVSREKQIWHCFGCGKGGDIISFVQEYEGVDFKEAIRILAERANVTLSNMSFEKKEDYSRLYEINQTAAKFYQNILNQDDPISHKAMKYLQEARKIKKANIDKWELGLSGESWDGLYRYLISEGYKDDDVFKAGLVVKRKDGSGYVDRFRKRLMFPIFDTQGKIVAFTSRTLAGIVYDEEEQGGKYINSPQTVIYDKSKTLYGWHFAKDMVRKKKYLIVVEGNMDVIAAHQAETTNVVAVSGTALTLDHLKLIKRYSNNVILAFDSDQAGLLTSFRAFKNIRLGWEQDMNFKVLLLPAGKDPADVIKEDKSKWLEAIAKSLPLVDYYQKKIMAAIDKNRADHKKIAAQKLLYVIKFLQSEVEQEHYIRKLSDELKISIETLKSEFAKIKTSEDIPSYKNIPLEEKSKKDNIILLSEQLLAIAFFKPSYLEKMIEEIEPDLLEESLRSLYSQTIIYYTKHHSLPDFSNNDELSSQDKKEWIRLSLLGEENYAEASEKDIDNDWHNLSNRVRYYYLDSQKQALIKELRQAELSNDANSQDKLAHEINLLNKEIHKLQS
ncbi:DNA primase [Candidatus Parcubacteria bacterium]|nr:MAG: DNA primase [Candidatus Parcubacteria bacterium]